MRKSWASSVFFVVAGVVLIHPSGRAQLSTTANSVQSKDIQLNGDILPLLRIADSGRQGTVYQSGDIGISILGSVLKIAGQD